MRAVGNYAWSVVIEGIPYVLTNRSDTALIADAYAGSAWDGKDVYSGLFVDCQNVGKLHPADPFIGGGSCRLTVHPDRTDRVGISTARKNAGAETQLVVAADRDDTTLTVRSTSAFAASGEAYVGNECFSYSGKTATTFTGCVRGLYAPFTRSASTAWGLQHRYGNEIFGAALEPAVTLYPRTWKGRKVLLRKHALSGGVASAWDSSDTESFFAGAIADIEWDQRGNTVFVLKSMQETLREQVVGRRLWAGKLKEGIYLSGGTDFDFVTFKDYNGGSIRAANQFRVVSAGAVAPNQINQGTYTVDEILSFINDWLSSELAAARLYGTYTWSPRATSEGWRTGLNWRLNAASGQPWWRMTMSAHLAGALGLRGVGGSTISGYTWESNTVWGGDDTEETWTGAAPPKRITVGHGTSAGNDWTVETTEQRGVASDQQSLFPGAAGGPEIDDNLGPGGQSWGLFLVDNKLLIRAGWDPAGNAETLVNVTPLEGILGGEDVSGPSLTDYGRDYGDGLGDMVVRQVLFLEGKARDVWKHLLYSSGTLGYNVAIYDSLGYGVGAALPHGLLGDDFDDSLDVLAGADEAILVVIDKPVKVAELMSVDMILRRAHIIFDNGHFKAISWSTPAADLAVHELTEENKAVPYSNDISHRTVTRETSEYQKAIIDIKYNRGLKDSTYRSTIHIEDLTAVDDLDGNAGKQELSARNTYGDVPETGAGLEQIAPGYIALTAYFSRPILQATRSMAPSLYGVVKPGDITLVTDPWIRDPRTGTWGVTQLPALVMEVKWDLGGAGPDGKSRPTVGEVTVAFLALDRFTAYAPCAQFAAADYNSGTKTITTQAHEHSELGVAADASRFAAGAAIQVVLIDPSAPATAVQTRNVVSVSGNDIVHDGLALTITAGQNYRVVSQPYASASSVQKSKTYQADDADGMIQDLAQPYQMGHSVQYSSYTKSVHTELAERYSTSAYGDGVALDTGHARGYARTVNALYDHIAAMQAPVLDSTAGTGGAGTYHVSHMFPIPVGVGVQPSFIERFVYAAPFFRSKTGVAVNCRVSLSRLPIVDDTLDDVTFPDPANLAQHVFTSPASTNWTTPTAVGLNLRVADPDIGMAWLIIECSADCECRGPGELVVREREIAVP